MSRVLVTEALSPEGLAVLSSCCQVDVRLKPTPSELIDLLPAYDALIVRSATQVTAEVLAAGTRLQVVGRAGTGVDNIDVDAATRRGIVVVNAPTSNTIAVAEHTMALMLALARHICAANSGLHEGRWEKQRLMGTELRGKTLGLVGLGRVGQAVAARARAMEMRVVAYDPFMSPERAGQMNVELASMEALLAQADYVSLHAPATASTRGMIGRRELALMKKGARLVNCARGELVVEEDLLGALAAGHLAGAALDVFENEPQIDAKLTCCPQLLLTPHLGASTEEAQSGAARQVVEEVLAVLQARAPRYPVNVLALSPEESAFLAPYLDLANRLGRFCAQFALQHLSRVELTYAGDIADHDTAMVTSAALVGLLSESSEEHVNVVNVRLVAQDRGLVVNEMRTSETQDLAGLVTLEVQNSSDGRILGGSIIRGRPHVVRIDDYSWFDFTAEGLLLVSEHVEAPGIIGQMGTLLGEAGINISFVQVGRQARGGRGLMVTGIDDAVPPDVLDRVLALPSTRSARVVRL
jgi:D-3-phosphoglycerate dehydrogenase